MKKFEVYLKHFILKLLLFIYSKKSEAVVPPSFDESSSFLFIRLNRIGDALVTTPLFSLIKQKLGARIFILADKKNHFIFRNNPNIDEVFIFQKGLKGFKHFKHVLAQNNIDAVIDLHDDVSTTVSMLIAASSCRFRFGLSKGNDTIYTHTVERLDASSHHVVDRVLEFRKLFNIEPVDGSLNIEYLFSNNALHKIEMFLNENYDDRFLFGINISAGSSARYWGTNRFKEVINDLADYNINLLLITAEKDIHFAEEISEDKITIFHSPNFDEFAAVVSKLDFLFTPDTSIVHLASAYNVPLFGLYVKFNTKDMIWVPYKSKYEYVVTEEENFNNLSYSQFRYKFLSFFKSILNQNK